MFEMSVSEQAHRCMQLQQWGHAVPLWQAVLQQHPEDAQATLALAECLRHLDLLDEAVVMVRNALAQLRSCLPADQWPSVRLGAAGREGALWAQAALQLAQLHAAQFRYAEAGAGFSEWLAHPVWGHRAAVGLAGVWLHEGYPTKAIEALTLHAQSHAEAREMLALARFEAGDAAGALANVWPQTGQTLVPHALSNALMFASYLPDCAHYIQNLRASAEDLWRSADTNWMGSVGPNAAEKPVYGRLSRERSATRPLRVGWVSADFYAHPIGYFLAAFWPHLRHEGIENFCYDNGRQHDAWTERLQLSASGWVSIAGWSAEAVCAAVAQDGLDVLIDLSGHTQGHRLDVFAQRACGVQASYLGYFSTTLVPAMDYLITDAVHVLAHEQDECSEDVVYLPGSRFCYSPPVDAPNPLPPPVLRNGYVTWGAFANVAKISDGCVALWASVLLAMPDSRLQLRWKSLVDSGVRQSLRERFASHGVALGRIELYGAVRHADLLAAYGEVDVTLDTWPFSGATTTCESLWMGVPVVTLVSDRPAGRQSASILLTLGQSDWIADTREAFVQQAYACASNVHGLIKSRQGLREKIASTSLGDGRLFAKGFAQTLRGLV